MKLAIMQPYFMPYIGYWQLMGAVDKFVLLDDVAFIPRGWIHRNRILVAGDPHLFTLPIQKASQNQNIQDTHRLIDERWTDKFIKTLSQNYRRASHFSAAMEFLEPLLRSREEDLTAFIESSLSVLAPELGIFTPIERASRTSPKREKHGSERIMEICGHYGARTYINPPGGTALYDSAQFAAEGIELRFLEPRMVPYVQGAHSFVPALSMIDILMHVGVAGARAQVQAELAD